MSIDTKNQRAILKSIARRAMSERGLLPDAHRLKNLWHRSGAPSLETLETKPAFEGEQFEALLRSTREIEGSVKEAEESVNGQVAGSELAAEAKPS